ncbi:hypothetical protein A3B58_03795 [Candidatus Amesbacteria bacterium RIFCSPLOWO2_01_FULL_48_50]|nr:MAG: hypothetical protein A2V48_01755 [Candidatus Amesbacteria bacterium RBG_19FT_COMBO_48_16]OGD04685.1 MAG: hypothetical protein A3B58_03795 [Candidatus Amesbacteria bacterium RIFCSPLOWO2_01_FULL_48_50]
MNRPIYYSLLLLILPTFSLLFRPGLHTTHDFHFFRQFEFDRCIADGIFPCRWSANAGMGYGEPVYNYYGQFPYWLGQVFRFVNFSVIDSVKSVFIVSLLLSAVFMYLLARRFWGNLGGLISAAFYVYAPYRAVDVWVRGALPESLAFVFYPVILWVLDLYLETPRPKYLWALALAGSALILTHNLSALMFVPFALVWYFWRAGSLRRLTSAPGLLLAFIASLLLAAFYLFPVIFESRLVTLSETTKVYYEYGLHFASLSQLFLSRFWGYGGSVWGPNDTMSFSVGHLHWLAPLLTLTWLFLRRQFRSPITVYCLLFTFLGFFAIFLTHGKSDFLWRLLPPMLYIQFPWRFLTMSTLWLSLATGVVSKILPNKIIPYLLLLLLFTNSGFFRPDIWRSITDSQQFSGQLWDEQRSSSLSDYWPKYASRLPAEFAPSLPDVVSGNVAIFGFQKLSQSAEATLAVDSESAEIRFPIAYFPGWQGKVSGKTLAVYPSGELGLVTLKLPAGIHDIRLSFADTPVRRMGNLISLAALILLPVSYSIKIKNHASA